ncbi:LysM peptidoglycan-binding domain-containing protein [Macrococcus psychrotolerans]|uniref:LysM peptidoglycan-binding domain-containing protein n=1 Tax=Macrococcus psychrotolerans TaxID=3039389 RepID=A0AAT9P2E0_9STAP|nr:MULTISPECIES: LysM peptidoglycan-binding domain-containing protein [Macrococcus]QYA32650.1 LysM peptidoglycan-binding domain-containing protein [Macrococcus sp. 19Msa1099]QYA37462.1 LysM peptidoglycan-binding domain-containing protein [Macrococcus caseolyticus]QYA76169.1 LysM peptidoglycan-binding domain-containing protein [Macrococcus caseolyticus]
MKKITALTGMAILATGISAQADAKEHTVTYGESLWSIADKYDTTVERIKKINKIESDIILPNQKLEVLVKGKYEVQKGDTLEKIAKKFDTKVADLKRWNNIETNKNLKVGKLIVVDKEEKRQIVTQTAAQQAPVTVQQPVAYQAPVVKAPEQTAKPAAQQPVQQVAQKPVAQKPVAQVEKPVAQQPVQQAPVEQPVQQAAQKPVQQAAPAGNSSMDAHLRVIAQRESGGNPNAVNASGYYGLFQFSPSTWASVGGTGNPANASVEEQWKRARILYQTAGASQWSTAY